MRTRIVQAVALVVLLHVVAPLVDPNQVEPGELAEHYGETVALRGRVTEVDAAGDVVRVAVDAGGERATVLTRQPPPPLGATVDVRGSPAPGEAGPVLWAEGRIEEAAAADDVVSLAQLLDQAPRREGEPVAVAGTWTDEGALVGSEGRLAVDPAGLDPEPGPVLLWGRLVYEDERARYELEATGWRPWTPPAS